HPKVLERQAEQDESRFEPLAFAPYIIERCGKVPGVRVRHSASVKVMLGDFYARAEWRDAMDSLRTAIRKVLQAQLGRCQRKAELLQQEMAKGAEADHYRLFADLLLAHQNEVQQGQSSVTVQNFFETNSEED